MTLACWVMEAGLCGGRAAEWGDGEAGGVVGGEEVSVRRWFCGVVKERR